MHILRVMPVAGATDGLINESLTLREAWPDCVVNHKLTTGKAKPQQWGFLLRWLLFVFQQPNAAHAIAAVCDVAHKMARHASFCPFFHCFAHSVCVLNLADKALVYT